MRGKVKEAELRADDDRRLKHRVETESASILEENTFLQQKIDDLERNLGRVSEISKTIVGLPALYY